MSRLSKFFKAMCCSSSNQVAPAVKPKVSIRAGKLGCCNYSVVDEVNPTGVVMRRREMRSTEQGCCAWSINRNSTHNLDPVEPLAQTLNQTMGQTLLRGSTASECAFANIGEVYTGKYDPTLFRVMEEPTSFS